jgi:hypothetical protein
MKAWFDWIPAFAGMTNTHTHAVIPANAGIQSIEKAQQLISGV